MLSLKGSNRTVLEGGTRPGVGAGALAGAGLFVSRLSS